MNTTGISPISTSARMGSATQYTRLSFTLMRMAEISASTSIIGQRMAMRIIIWKAIWILATSEVSRVTMEAVENLSMLEKLNSCT